MLSDGHGIKLETNANTISRKSPSIWKFSTLLSNLWTRKEVKYYKIFGGPIALCYHKMNVFPIICIDVEREKIFKLFPIYTIIL